MPWFKVDDNLAFNAKFITLPLSAAGLWVRAGAWCAQQLTDGKIPTGVVAAIGGGDDETDALEAAGLWHKTRGGWTFHDWMEYQPTAESVRAEREAAAKRMREKRAKWKGVIPVGTDERSEDVRPNTSRTHDERSDEVREKFGDPDPSLPIPSPSPSRPSSKTPSDFDAFWAAYPRKVGKDDAKKAWTTASKREGSEHIVEGAVRFASDPNLPEKQFIPHPGKWLREGRWGDEPLPPRRGTGGRGQAAIEAGAELFQLHRDQPPQIGA